MFVTGWGLTGSAQAVADQFEGKYASAFYPLTDKFVGSGLTTMVEILIITSSFACSMAFYNTGSRYVFSLGARGRAPARARPHAPDTARAGGRVDGRVGDHRRLHAGFALADSSTLAALLKLGTWTPLLGVLGILAVQGLVLRRDRPLLPDRRARRLPPLQDADRAADRLPRDGRGVLPADRQPRGAVGRGRRAVHQTRPMGGARRVPDRLRRGAVDAPPGTGALPAASGASCARKKWRHWHEHARRTRRPCTRWSR